MTTKIDRPAALQLAPEEKELLRCISFSSFNHETLRTSCEAAGLLARSLLDRRAIPEVRMRYFMDAELNIGAQISRKETFEVNGTKGEAILSHGNFLPYLRYFVFGPILPSQVIDAFWQAVTSAGYVSGGDMESLRAMARSATRQHRLDARTASEEFFKLVLECGMDLTYARSIRDAVRAVR